MLVKLKIAVASQDRIVRSKGAKLCRMNCVDLSSTGNGAIFPHAVLFAQQISLLSCQKPMTSGELEKVIAKVKTAKYGSRNIELMMSHTNSSNQGKEASDEHGAKKIKMKDKDVVCVESSEEE